jgi:hypothetical protein
MKQERKILTIMLLCSFLTIVVLAQTTNPATGGNATGTGGSLSYSVGQVVYTTNTGTNGIVSQGVQQPYEISVVTAIRSTGEINPECNVFPNPTRRDVKLVVGTNDFENLRFQIYDMNGIRIQDKKIESEETEILMDSLSPSTYFLKVLSGNKEIKTFKIIKN